MNNSSPKNTQLSQSNSYPVTKLPPVVANDSTASHKAKDQSRPKMNTPLAPLNLPRNSSSQSLEDEPAMQRIASLKKMRPISPSDSVSSFSRHNLLKKALSPKPYIFHDLFDSSSDESSVLVDLNDSSPVSSRLSSPSLPPLKISRGLERAISDVSFDSTIGHQVDTLISMDDF